MSCTDAFAVPQNSFLIVLYHILNICQVKRYVYQRIISAIMRIHWSAKIKLEAFDSIERGIDTLTENMYPKR